MYLAFFFLQPPKKISLTLPMLLIYFFREDPLVLWGYCINDRLVLLSLAFLSLLAVWVCDMLQNLALGLGIGVFICGVHTLLRNFDGLFLDENNTVSIGLVYSTATTSIYVASLHPVQISKIFLVFFFLKTLNFSVLGWGGRVLNFD